MNESNRPLATLDHNVLVGYFKVEAAAPDRTPRNVADAEALRDLLALYRTGAIRLMVGAAVTLENRPQDKPVDLAAEYAKLVALGFDREDIFTRPLSIPVVVAGLDDVPIFGPHLEIRYQQLLHALLWEGKTQSGAMDVDFSWYDFRERGG